VGILIADTTSEDLQANQCIKRKSLKDYLIKEI